MEVCTNIACSLTHPSLCGYRVMQQISTIYLAAWKMAEYIVKKLIEQIIEKALENVAWDVYYMKIACLAALRSKDPSTPVSYNNNMVL